MWIACKIALSPSLQTVQYFNHTTPVMLTMGSPQRKAHQDFTGFLAPPNKERLFNGGCWEVFHGTKRVTSPRTFLEGVYSWFKIYKKPGKETRGKSFLTTIATRDPPCLRGLVQIPASRIASVSLRQADYRPSPAGAPNRVRNLVSSALLFCLKS